MDTNKLYGGMRGIRAWLDGGWVRSQTKRAERLADLAEKAADEEDGELKSTAYIGDFEYPTSIYEDMDEDLKTIDLMVSRAHWR